MTAELETTCPGCGRKNELHHGPNPGDVPEAGDVSLCWLCGTIGIYTDKDLRLANEEELLELLQDEELAAAIHAVRRAREGGMGPLDAARMRRQS